MVRMLYRLLAYLVAGTFLGAAGWLILYITLEGTEFSIALILTLAAIGLASAWILLKRSRANVDDGIRINTPWNVAAMDGVCIIAATIISLFIIDGNSNWFSGASPLLGSDPYAMDVVIVMYLPSALVLALFVTSTSSQTIAIDEKGLTIAGAFGVETAKWEAVEKLSPDEQYVVVSRLGVPIPRHLRTNLEIITNDSDVLTVYQPGLKSTAKAVLDKFKQQAPPRLHNDLEKIEKAWL